MDKRQGLVSYWLKCLVFQRSDSTSKLSKADLFDSTDSHWAAFWLCFFDIAIFDSTFSNPPCLTPPSANVFSHSICSTVTGGIMPLPFPSLCDVWHARSTNETPGPGNAMFTPNKSNNVTALWRYFNSSGACFLPNDKTTQERKNLTGMLSVWSSDCVSKTRSEFQLFSLKLLSNIDCVEINDTHFRKKNPDPLPPPPNPHRASQSHQISTTSTTCLHQPLSILFNIASNQREQSRGAFVLCIYVCPSPTGPAVPIKNSEKTISRHHLISAR